MSLLDYAALTLREPRRGLRAVLDLGLPLGAGLAALALMAVGSALLLHLSMRMMPVGPVNPVIAMLVGSPFQAAAMQAAILLVTAGLLHRLGRAWGGAGRLDQAVVAVAWFQAFFVALQALQLLLDLLLPALSGYLGIASLVLFFWLLTQFTVELHGFRSSWLVFAVIVAVMVAMSFLLSFLLILALGPEALADV